MTILSTDCCHLSSYSSIDYDLSGSGLLILGDILQSVSELRQLLGIPSQLWSSWSSCQEASSRNMLWACKTHVHLAMDLSDPCSSCYGHVRPMFILLWACQTHVHLAMGLSDPCSSCLRSTAQFLSPRHLFAERSLCCNQVWTILLHLLNCPLTSGRPAGSQ